MQHPILAVDDNPMNLAVMQEILSDYGLRTAASGEQALALLETYRPELVLLDIMMPGIDGYEVCERIRANESLRDTKVIMVTAKETSTERLRGYRVGADDYVTKPFDEEELRAKIKVYLRLRSMEEIDRFRGSMLKLLNAEVRAPLSGMISAADMIFQDDSITRDERKAMAVHVSNTGRNLYALFSKVIKLGVLKSRQHVLQRVDANLCDVLRSAVCEVRSKTSRPDVRIEEQSLDCPAVHIDNEEIKNALVAVLENAIDASPANGQVTVKMASDRSRAFITITDHGPGMDEAVLRELFAGFSEASQLHKGGRGLDLAIAYELVEQQGGAIRVQTSADRGTAFTLELPLCQTARPDEAALSVS